MGAGVFGVAAALRPPSVEGESCLRFAMKPALPEEARPPSSLWAVSLAFIELLLFASMGHTAA